MSGPDDERFMRRAIELAQRGWGRTHPNPMVGAVLVEDGQVVAEGFHAADGGPHAEKAALEALGRRPGPGATLYVTLEPCSTAGRTGACTEAILAAGIKRVVIGATDPNPAHAGSGFRVLEAAGVRVESGLLDDACTELNLLFNHWIVRGEPLLAGKLASTLDGRIATRSGESRWITGEEARADVHHWRRLFPAIAVGAGTLATDNPSLTARGGGLPVECPVRFVFDGHLTTVIDRKMPKVYTDEHAARTVVVTTAHAGEGYVRKLRALGVGVWVFPSPSGRVSLAQFRARCAAEGIVGVLFEGGAELMSRALIERQIDYLMVYQAPVLLGDERAKPVLSGLRTETLSRSIRLAEMRRAMLGDDSLLRGRVVYPERMQVDETLFSLG
jgi:diaminohydroxyphosphoribosylaminopyrimidine deaminase / 5-amino-6-(5-phosphoribosylamino)uracil reductase